MQVSNFNDEAGRPLSALFQAPIPAEAAVTKREIGSAKHNMAESLLGESVLQLVDASFAAADLDKDDRLARC